jgi:pSer/pThr/pTyr-binding forkhead associated (FHA) protein
MVTIGRSGADVDLPPRSGGEESPISRRHCTILEEDGLFYIRDEQSANGTSRNGIRLVPLERQMLADGDVIHLADPKRGGVRLQFRLPGWTPSPAESDVEATSRVIRP